VIKPNRIESKPFRLNPGILVDDKRVTECVVTLLTRGEKKNLQKEPETTREDTTLAQSIVRLGEMTDRTLILANLDNLAEIDVLRINREIQRLEEQCFEAGEVVEPFQKRTMNTSEILSEAFSLNPGVTINGKEQQSCVVRLLRRGEIKEIERAGTDAAKDDLFFLYAIVQIGDCMNVTLEHIDCLAEGDVQRINEVYEELRAQHAPSLKSAE
jgi:hypothetical protein